MDANRREFAALAGAAAAIAAAPKAEAAGFDPAKDGPDVWHRRVKRMIQINFNERDPEDFDPKAFGDWLQRTKAQVAYVSVTGIVAFYPTKIADFPRSRWLGKKDLLGDCVKACKANGTRVMGRMSPDMASVDLIAKHPDWFRRDKNGNTIGRLADASTDPATVPPFAATCQFTSYYGEQIPRIIKEVIANYDIDGIYTNGWPGLSVPPCYCEVCKKIGDPRSEDYKRAYQKRTEELWAMYAKIIADHRADMIFSGNLGGRFKGGDVDLSSMLANASIFTADNQGRGGVGDRAWDVSQQVRLARALMKGRTVTNVTGSYERSNDLWWRNVTGNQPEIKVRLAQTAASGATLWYHWLGNHEGWHEDRRWQLMGAQFLSWQAANDQHFHNVRSIASVAILVSQRSNRLYKDVPGTDALQSLEGMYEILTEARIPFDVVVDTELEPQTLAQYSVLILPNVALMSDRQIAQIKAFAGRGGSLLTSFETALYDENGKPRPDFGFADLYGMHKAGERVGAGSPKAPPPHFWQRLEQPAGAHPVTAGFKGTNWIQGGSCRQPIRHDGPVYMTNVAAYPSYPPESVFSPRPHTDESLAVFRDNGKSRLVYFAGDTEAAYARTGAADLGDLITNAVQWLMQDDRPLSVTGNGLVETFGWVTEPGYAVHLINYTYPNFKSGARRASYSVGAQKVRMVLADARPIKAARLLWANRPLAFTQNGNVVEFTMPDLVDYEVAALET
ncbi:MAG: hypothetical protein JWO50_893 [Candidatus Kaiserbacteria bacterium]|nr:hypothetical protein [Candidatus Kaiserbacteria bacterium]